MSSTADARLDHRSIGVLGILTIFAFGVWYYSFGVLLDPIIDDTGWRESTLTASFSVGIVVVGLASLVGGRMLDTVGHRAVFLLGGVVTLAGMLTASFAEHVAVFFLGAVIALGASGALGMYHVTMPTAVRLNPHAPARAIAVLTIWGAFASAISLPLTAWLVDEFGWRVTVRVLAALIVGAFWVSALTLPTLPGTIVVDHVPVRRLIGRALFGPVTRWFALAVGLGGVAMSTVLVYQVPAMTALGLSAGTAATLAAFRGLCQLLGRLPLSPIVDRLGSDRAFIVAFAAIVAGGLLLTVAETVALGALFAIVAGFGIGAYSPLQGIRASELFDHDHLGVTMGLYGAVLLLAGSIGPLVTGFLVEATDERRWAGVVTAVAAGLAALAIARLARAVAEQALGAEQKASPAE